MVNKKGQGTIEYLVIIAIVIVIALVVVGLLLQVMDQGSAVPEQSAKLAWQSAAPIAIVDWDGNSGGGLTIVLKNNSYQTVTNASITIAGSESNDVNIISGDTATVGIASIVTSGERFAFVKTDITITYDTPDITGRTQSGAADIIGTAG